MNAVEARYESNSLQETKPYLCEIAAIQFEFNQVLGLKNDPQDHLRRSYNPVIDRWHIERLRNAHDEDGVNAYRKEIRENLKTNLMERLHAVESVGEYAIREGELYSRDFPEKPFSQVLKRGVEYRASLGSGEQAREGHLGELSGWEVINSVLANPDVIAGTTIYSLSPHGVAENTVYDGWFVDKFVVKQERGGEKTVERVRTAVDWDYRGFRQAALSLRSDYFDEYDGRPEDAWYLSHPIVKSEDNLELVKKGMSKQDFSQILEDYYLERLMNRYEQVLSARIVDWHEVAYAFNAMLNHADDLKDQARTARNSIFKLQNIQRYDPDDGDFLNHVRVLGQRSVRTVTGGGCPPNKGINFGGNSGIDILSNSVAKFGIEDGKRILCCTCPFCGREVEAVIASGKITCPECDASANWSETATGE